MPRPEAPLDGDGPVVDLARALRDLRTSAGNPGYRELANTLHYSAATLSRATSGRQLPTWPVVKALTLHCGGDLQAINLMWRRAAQQRPEPPSLEGDDEVPVDPDPEGRSPAAPRRLRAAARRISTSRFVVVLAAAILSLALGVTALAVLRPSSSTDASPTVTIQSPDFYRANSSTILYGKITDIPNDELLWAATFNPTTGLFYPLDRPCAVSSSNFNCGQYYFGGNPGNYTVILFMADVASSNSLLQYQIDKGGPDGPNPGLVALPAGTRELLRKQVFVA